MRSRVFAVVVLATLLTGCATAAHQKEQARRERIAQANTNLGVAFIRQGRYDLAKQKLERALQYDPDDSQANEVMGVLMMILKEYGKAEKYLERAVREDPHNSDAQYNYGVLLCNRGHIDKAVKWFDKALSDPLYKTPAQTNLTAGLCLMKKPAPQEAEPYFRAALGLDPTMPQALYYLARITYDTGRLVAAQDYIHRYFKSGKDTPEALLLAAQIEHALGHKDREADYVLRLRNEFPDSPQVEQLHQPYSVGG